MHQQSLDQFEADFLLAHHGHGLTGLEMNAICYDFIMYAELNKVYLWPVSVIQIADLVHVLFIVP